jgi:predicted  nucleic acid-binding Zn-ribbon protein
MRIEVHVHLHHSATLESKIDKILEGQNKLMATAAELKQELVDINTTTDEIAADVDDLVNNVPNGSEFDEVRDGLKALGTRLKGIASQHTPNSPV